MPLGGLITGGIGLLGSIGSNIIGSIAAGGDRDAARAAMQQALQQIQNVGAPPDMARQIILQKFKSAGILTPQLEQTINQQVSQVAGIQEDPSLRNAQTSALGLIGQRGQVGLGAEDIAALGKIRSQAMGDAEAQRQAVMQQLQARGQYGSGAELASQLAASQAGSQRESDAGINQAGIASQRALEALVAGGQLGGQIRSQDFNVANTKAQAADNLNRFNTQNAIQTQMRNVGSQNAAQQYNLNNSQQIDNANTQQANAEALRQLQGQQQNWQNQLGLAQARAGALTANANDLRGQAQQTAQGWANIGSGIGTAAGAMQNYLGQQQMIGQNQQWLDRAYPKQPNINQSNYGPVSSGSEYAGYVNQAGGQNDPYRAPAAQKQHSNQNPDDGSDNNY